MLVSCQDAGTTGIGGACGGRWRSLPIGVDRQSHPPSEAAPSRRYSAVMAAVSGLEGMTLPDLIKGSCELGGMRLDLGGMRRDPGRIVSAWRDPADGRRVSPVSPEDQVLADLGPPAKWHDTD